MIYLQLLTPALEFQPIIENMIHSIWPQPYAHEAYKATAVDAYLLPKRQIYAIRHRMLDQSVVTVGITGFFNIDNRKGAAYLRWTGILPTFRGQGMFREAIRQLVLTLEGANPDLCSLVELVPDNDYGRREVIPAFTKLGFVRDDTFSIPKGEDDDWPCIPYVLHF